MADISKISIDGGATEYNIKDATARAGVQTINEKIGASNGIATLNGSGKVPESQLPSYVDDVIEGYYYEGAFYSDNAHTTLITPETGKIYVDLTEDKTYRWSGSVYVCVGGSGNAVWGGITGVLENQTDLKDALDAKTSNEATEFMLKDTVGFSVKNILNCDIASGSHTKNGLTIYVTKYTDGTTSSIRVNGTATANTSIEIASLIETDNDYILSGCPEGGSSSTYSLRVDGDFGASFSDYGDGVLISDTIVNGKAYIVVKNGYTANNLYFYPMIRNKYVNDYTYERYYENVLSRLNKKANLTDISNLVPQIQLKDTVGWTGKNLLKIPASVVTLTTNGVTFTVNRNGDNDIESIVANGTATQNAYFTLVSRELNEGSYILSGCPSGGGSSTFELLLDYNGTDFFRDYGNSISFTLNSDRQEEPKIVVRSGQTVNNLVFKPMLRKADIVDDTYEPYHPSVEQTLRDAEVIEGKNALCIPNQIKEINGVTATVTNGVISFSGTNSSSSATWIDLTCKIRKGTYKFSGLDVSQNVNNIIQILTSVGGTNIAQISTETPEVTFTLNDDFEGIVYCRIAGNGNADGIKAKLMLRFASDPDNTFEPYYIPLKDSKFDRAEQRVLGAKNALNYNTLRSLAANTIYELTDNSIQVVSSVAGTWLFASFWLKNLEKNTDYIFTLPSTNVVSGASRIWMRDVNTDTTIFESSNVPSNFVYRFNTKNFESICITFYSSTDSSSVGDVTYNEPMIRLASDTDDTYVPYAMTNRQLTENKISYKDNGILGAKNLLAIPQDKLKSANTGGTWSGNNYTYNGLTFACEFKNGYLNKVSVSGTASADTGMEIYKCNNSDPIFVGKKVRISGCPSGGSESSYYINGYRIGTVDGSGGSFKQTGDDVVIDFLNNGSGTKGNMSIAVVNGTNLSTPVSFYPMIRLESDPDSTYQPYAMTNREITEELSVQESEVGSIVSGASVGSDVGNHLVKIGKIVTLDIRLTSVSAGEWADIGIIPLGFRPKYRLNVKDWAGHSMAIKTGGAIQCASTLSNAEVCIHATWITD